MNRESNPGRRLAVHRALADDTRLRIVDELAVTDRTPRQLARALAVESNRLAFHLAVLERAGLVSRRASQGDGRRRYVHLEADGVAHAATSLPRPPRLLLFVCSANAARSPLAAAVWRQRTGRTGISAGREPAGAVDPTAVAVARDHGLDLSAAAPRGYEAVDVAPDLVVSVCDRAGEQRLPFGAPRLHWSVPDPRGRDRAAYDAAYDAIAEQVDRLAAATAA